VTPDELAVLWASRDRENVLIVDVRSGEEYTAGHIAGAVSVPGSQAVQATDDAIAVRTGQIVLVCDGLVRSAMTAAWLHELGLPNVSVLRGGTHEWVAEGGDFASGPPSNEPAGWAEARRRVPAVSVEALHGSAAAVIDVDDSAAYARGHVRGAAWL